MITKTRKILSVLTLMSMMIGISQSSSANQQTFLIKAKVEPSVTITKTLDLNFGSFTAVAGTVVIAPATDLRTTTGPLLVGTSNSRAEFALSGGPNAIQYQVYVNNDNSAINLFRNLTAGGGDDQMTVSAWQIHSVNGAAGAGSTGAAGTVKGQVTAAGVDTLYVGATITVLATNNPGEYSYLGTDAAVNLNVQFD